MLQLHLRHELGKIVILSRFVALSVSLTLKSITIADGRDDQVHSRKFYQNRCARLLPVYYLTNALALPGALAGTLLGVAEVSTAAAVAMIALTALNINSWLSPGFGIPGIMQPNAVTWTISTVK